MDITNVVDFIESRYRGEEISPVDIEARIRAIVRALDIFEEPDGMNIRFAFGTPIFDEDSFNDWQEESCARLSELSEDVKNHKYTVYEIWYDSDDEYEDLCGVEVMLYQK